MKYIYLAIVVLMTLPVLAQNREFNLKYAPQSDILQPSYMGNNAELRDIRSIIQNERGNIQAGRSHIALVSAIRPGDRNNPQAVNKASLNASVTRAYLKMQYGLSNEHFTFHFDDRSNIDGNVKVAFMSRSINVGENRDIHYTTSNNYSSYELIMGRYAGLPMVDNSVGTQQYANVPQTPSARETVSIAANNVATENREEGQQYRTVAVQINARSSEASEVSRTETAKSAVTSEELKSAAVSEDVKKEEPKRAEEKTVVYIQPVEEGNRRLSTASTKKPKSTSTVHPLFAVKTNLLYWAGYNPFSYEGFFDQEPVPTNLGNMLPNLEVEYYFNNKKYSIAGDLAYSVMNYSDGHWWKISSYSIEPRYWFGEVGAFKGLYAGVFGTVGDYDIYESIDVHNYGYTGMYYSGGLSVGYFQPIYKDFAIEVGVRGGYQYLNRDIYTITGGDYSFLSSDSVSGFRVLGVRASLVYRFKRK